MSYPNAYCVKCGAHTETVGKHTVVLENASRALHGNCPSCGSEVYRIMSKRPAAEATAGRPAMPAAAPAPAAVEAAKPEPMPRRAKSERRVALTRPATAATASQWSYVAAALAIVAIIGGFLLYSVP